MGPRQKFEWQTDKLYRWTNQSKRKGHTQPTTTHQIPVKIVSDTIAALRKKTNKKKPENINYNTSTCKTMTFTITRLLQVSDEDINPAERFKN